MSLDSLLQRWGQRHLLSLIKTQEEEKVLAEEILSFDEEALEQEMQSFGGKQREQKQDLLSPLHMKREKKDLYRKRGEEILRCGKAATLMLAAGEGTRLGFSGPKGCFPITVVQRKSLFQLFCEKILAAQKKYGHELFLMIMTSPLNHKETKDFFEKNHSFGLKEEQVAFFSQDLLPLCGMDGKWFLEGGKIASRAGGNGDLYKSFVKARLVDKCRERGIEKVLLFPVDNPLADPCDRDLLGFQEEKKCAVALKAIKRPKKEKGMGVLACTSKGVRVVEYMEISPQEMESFSFANTGLYCMSLSFLEQSASLSLPLHRVKKMAGIPTREVFKFERFLFDAFRFSNVEAFLDFKSACFAPLKRSKGKEGLAAVQKALLCKEQKLFYQCAKKKILHKNFELSQEFYYPTKELLDIYQKKNSLREGYFPGIDL